MPVESYSTVHDVKREIFKKVSLNTDLLHLYGLYEICEKKDAFEERFLEEKEMIMDLMTSWEVERLRCKDPKGILVEDPPEFKVCLRMRIYYDLNDSDIDGITMIYTQLVYDVVNSRIPLTEEIVLKLAAIQLQIDYGIYRGKSERIM